MKNTKEILPLIKLRFNIDHPSIEECYSYGYECASTGADEQDNPFAPNTLESEKWSDGWWAGFYGEDALFTLDEDTNKAANDAWFQDGIGKWLIRALEITGVIAVSAIVGYQVLDMVA